MRLSRIPLRQTLRNPIRTLLTILGVAIAMGAFGFLRTVIGIYYIGYEQAAADRLIVRNQASFVQPLPIAYRAKIVRVPHVTEVAAGSIFFSYLGDQHNMVGAFAIEAQPFLALYPEFVLSAAEKDAWVRDPSGCIVGRRMADKYRLHVGDTLTLQGTTYPGEWRFTIRGIYSGKERNTDTSGMAIHFHYLDESVEVERRGLPNVFLIGIDDPNRSPEVSRAIDALFRDTPLTTLTESEKSFQLSFLSMVSAVIRALQAVCAFVLVIMGLILGNTTAMSVRERAPEIAILKAIGYRGRHLAVLFGGESALLALVGGVLGAGLSLLLIGGFSAVVESAFGGALPPFVLSIKAMVAMVGISVGVGIAAAVLPVWRVARQSVADAFQRRA